MPPSLNKPEHRSTRQRIGGFISELKRRHVVQVTSVYLVAAWGFSAGAVDIFAVMGLSETASRYFVIALFAATPVVIIISWLFEADSSGIYRDYGSEPETRATTQFVGSGDAPALKVFFQDREQSFRRDFTVGRDDACEFQIVDPSISRRHATFEVTDGRWRVRDLGSRNGTTVDGVKVDDAWLDGNVSIAFYRGCPSFDVTVKADTTASTIWVEDSP